VSEFDAYDDEMRLRPQITDRDLERLLAGTPAPGDEREDQLASFIGDVKESYLEAPESSVEAQHLAAIVDAAGTLALSKETAQGERPGPAKRRKTMLRNRFALTAAGALAIVPLSAGLAVAGVTLPAPAQTAFDKLGLELPNQDGASEGSSVSEAVLGVVFTTDEKGCAFGLKVADAADANRRDAGHGPPENPCERGENGDGNGNGSGATGRQTGEDASEFGRETAEEARSLGGSAADGGGRDFGERTAEEAKNQGAGGSQGGGSVGDDASAGGRSTGDKAAENGRSIGDNASEAGRSTGDDASGGGRAIGGQASGGDTP
jgi:hypothetical protein